MIYAKLQQPLIVALQYAQPLEILDRMGQHSADEFDIRPLAISNGNICKHTMPMKETSERKCSQHQPGHYHSRASGGDQGSICFGLQEHCGLKNSNYLPITNLDKMFVRLTFQGHERSVCARRSNELDSASAGIAMDTRMLHDDPIEFEELTLPTKPVGQGSKARDLVPMHSMARVTTHGKRE